MIKDSLGDRMKMYEEISNTKLIPQLPVIIRIDGRSFHTLTRGLQKPYDENFVDMMNQIGIILCKEIQNARFAYVQSDEISILLYEDHFLSEPWFGNRLSKITSISAAIATGEMIRYSSNIHSLKSFYEKGMFDSRAFNLPVREVCNYFIWRQADWIRNSKTMFASKYLSPKQLNNVPGEVRVAKAEEISGESYENFPTWFRLGRCIVKKDEEWIVNNNIPLFKENRDYVDSYLKEEEECL